MVARRSSLASQIIVLRSVTMKMTLKMHKTSAYRQATGRKARVSSGLAEASLFSTRGDVGVRFAAVARSLEASKGMDVAMLSYMTLHWQPPAPLGE